MEYGYINEDGFLRVRDFQPEEVKFFDETLQVQIIKTISVEEQLLEIGGSWKPVERIDEKMMVPSTQYEAVIPIPYDSGKTISYKYERVFNAKEVEKEIRLHEEALNASDYKIVKCYEQSLMGATQLPYNISSLHAERQAHRDKINELELLLTQNQK